MPLIMGPNTSGVAATTSGLGTEVRYRTGSGSEQVIHYPEAASADFQKGELVLLSAGGVLQVATAPAALAASAVLNTANVPIVGMALADASGTTGALCPILVANADSEFCLRVYAAAATDAQLQDVNVGDAAELQRFNTGGNIQCVVSAAPDSTLTENQVIITEKPSVQGATDEYPWVWVKVLYSSRAVD